MHYKVSRIIRDIKSLTIQGAREVAKAGLGCFILTAKYSKAKSMNEFMKEIKGLVSVLVKTRPTEPMLKNVIASVMLKLNNYDGDNFKDVTVNLCNDEIGKINQALAKIAGIGASQIENGDRVLTHCHSHTVVEILRKAKKEGKKFQVIVTETRPMLQGVLTAKDLSKAGIETIFCVDSAIGYVMKKTTKVLTGTDGMILPDGSIVNKIGTFPIALIAKQFGKPFMIAGETYKFTSDMDIEIEQRNPNEIINPKSLPNVKIINPAFDVTPAGLIDLIITEKGAVRPRKIKELINEKDLL